MEGHARSLLLPEQLRSDRATPRHPRRRFQSRPLPRARPEAARRHLAIRTVEGAAQRRKRRNRAIEARGRGYHRAAGADARHRRRDFVARRTGQDSRRGVPGIAGRHSQHSPRIGPGRQRFRGQRRSAARGPAAAIRFRTEGPLGPGPGVGHPRPRARRQDHRRALCSLLGPGRQAGARAHQLHARCPHPRARVYRGASALPGELRQPLRHGPVAQVQRGPVQVRGARPLADPHGRGSGHQHLPRRNPGSRCLADQTVRLHALFPQRGRLLRPRRARHHPPAPVSEGRAGEVHPARRELRGTREAHR